MENQCLVGHYESVPEGEGEPSELARSLPHAQNAKPDDTYDYCLVNSSLST